MADIEKLFEVDEHYVITSEVAQVTQSSVTPLEAYAVGTVMGQSLASPYAFEPSSGGSKVAQPATTTHPHKASNRVARPIIVRAVSLNIPVPTLTFKPYTVNFPLFNFHKDVINRNCLSSSYLAIDRLQPIVINNFRNPLPVYFTEGLRFIGRVRLILQNMPFLQ